MRTYLCVSFAALVAGAALSGCSGAARTDGGPGVVVVEQNEPGPPDHAPAHGYREKHPDRVVLVYDPDLDVYAVENHDRCYYSAGQYFRPGTKGWEWSVDVVGPWRRVKADSDLPPGLRKVDVSANHRKAKDK